MWPASLPVGEHFLAELIESQDEDHKTIVAEVREGGLQIDCLVLLPRKPLLCLRSMVERWGSSV